MAEATPPNPFSSSFNVQDDRACLIVIFPLVGYMPASLVKIALAFEFPNSSPIKLGAPKGDGTRIAFINFDSEKAYSLASWRINKEITVCGFTGIIRKLRRPAQPNQHVGSPVPHEKYDNPRREEPETSGREFGRPAQPKQHIESPVPHEKYDNPRTKQSEPSGKEFSRPAQPKQHKQHIESPVRHENLAAAQDRYYNSWREQSETSNESISRSYTIPNVRNRLWFEKRKNEEELAAIGWKHSVWIKPEWNDDRPSYIFSGTRDNIDKCFASFKAYAIKVTSELQSLPVQVNRQRAETILAQRDKITKIEQNFCVEILLPKLNLGVVMRATNQAIELVSGNIIHETVDAIVNAANSRLDHEGGIAKVIADAAGQQLRDECKNYIAQYRSMPTGQAFVTTAGDLQKKGVKYVIHAIGPVWSSGTNKEDERLHAAVANALLLANSKGCKTVALPPISTGLYGFPHEKGAKVIVDAIVQTLPKTRIHKVRIVDYNPEPEVKRAPVKGRDDADAEGANQQNSTEIYTMLRKELWERRGEIEDKDEIITGPGASSVFMPTFQPLPYQWFWKETVGGKHDNGQQWVMYDRDQNIEIENAHDKWQHKRQKRPSSFFDFIFRRKPDPTTVAASPLTPVATPTPVATFVKIVGDVGGVKSGTTYEILFDDNGHFQKNTTTGFKRPIMRKDIAIPLVANTHLPSPQVTSNSDEKPVPVNYKYWKDLVEFMITGRRADVAAAAQELESLVKPKTEFLLMGDLERIDRVERNEAVRMIAECLHVDVDFNNTDNTIKLTGHEGSVDTVRAEIYKWAFDKLANIDNDVPKGWDKFDEKVNCVLVALGATSKEWDTVVARVCQTMPYAKIQKIERVQNRHLWSTYQHNHRQMSKKNGGEVNVISLFHGTKTTPPSSIYESEEGFDPRFSAEGMWGKGCYFAVNASYSNNYAFTVGLGNKQFFLADVIAGDSIDLPSDSTITIPPVKAKQRGKFKNERYDSIKGYTFGSDIYVVYSPGRFYPTYLITYR